MRPLAGRGVQQRPAHRLMAGAVERVKQEWADLSADPPPGWTALAWVAAADGDGVDPLRWRASATLAPLYARAPFRDWAVAASLVCKLKSRGASPMSVCFRALELA